MKRTALLFVALALALASSAQAQLTMQMSNGWSFTFAGNVNAFFIYQTSKACAGTPNVCTTSGKDLGVGTGLLPAFAVFDAKGKEGNVDLGVHFGFAPQVEFGGHNASFFGTDAAGAQIDMRQVFLTAGGTWGTLTMGKELGLFQRGNILTDMTLLGVGVTGGPGLRGTSLGRIGWGYLYTDFRPQLTYTTAGGKSSSLSVGIMDPIRNGAYTVAQLPRVEAEFNWSGGGESTKYKFFVNGAVQSMKDAVVATGGQNGTSISSLSSTGVGGGIVLDFSGFALTGSGFYAKGMGSLLMGDGIVGGGNFANGGTGAPDATGVTKSRNSLGFIGQGTYTPKAGKISIGASWGQIVLKQNTEDKAATASTADVLKRRAIVGQFTYKWTKSLRWVFEYGHIDTFGLGVKNSKTDQGSAGMMLFF